MFVIRKWIDLSCSRALTVGVAGFVLAQAGLAGLSPAQAQRAVIVALCASNTWGKGVGRSQAYPAHLERLLRARGIPVVMLRNRLVGAVARTFPRPDGQHFKGAGTRAVAARLLPRVLAVLGRR